MTEPANHNQLILTATCERIMDRLARISSFHLLNRREEAAVLYLTKRFHTEVEMSTNLKYPDDQLAQDCLTFASLRSQAHGPWVMNTIKESAIRALPLARK